MRPLKVVTGEEPPWRPRGDMHGRPWGCAFDGCLNRQTTTAYWKHVPTACCCGGRILGYLLAQRGPTPKHDCRRLMRLAMDAWQSFLLIVRYQHDMMSAATVHHERSLCGRVLRKLGAHVRRVQEIAVRHDAARCLRCCVRSWHAYMVHIRAQTAALVHTMVQLDRMAGQGREEGQTHLHPVPPLAGIASSAVTGLLPPVPQEPNRLNADCTLTLAPASNMPGRSRPALAVRNMEEAGQHPGYDMQHSKGDSGSTAEILVLESQKTFAVRHASAADAWGYPATPASAQNSIASHSDLPAVESASYDWQSSWSDHQLCPSTSSSTHMLPGTPEFCWEKF